MLGYSIRGPCCYGSRNIYPRYARNNLVIDFILKVCSLVAILLMWSYSEIRLELDLLLIISSPMAVKLIHPTNPKHHSLAPSVYRLTFPYITLCQISNGSTIWSFSVPTAQRESWRVCATWTWILSKQQTQPYHTPAGTTALFRHGILLYVSVSSLFPCSYSV